MTARTTLSLFRIGLAIVPFGFSLLATLATNAGVGSGPTVTVRFRQPAIKAGVTEGSACRQPGNRFSALESLVTFENTGVIRIAGLMIASLPKDKHTTTASLIVDCFGGQYTIVRVPKDRGAPVELFTVRSGSAIPVALDPKIHRSKFNAELNKNSEFTGKYPLEDGKVFHVKDIKVASTPAGQPTRVPADPKMVGAATAREAQNQCIAAGLCLNGQTYAYVEQGQSDAATRPTQSVEKTQTSAIAELPSTATAGQ